MFKLIIFKLFALIISNCNAQSDQLTLIANPHHQLAFHQPDLGIHHQLNFHPQNHQVNLFQTSQPSRPPSQQSILRANRLQASASSPKSSVINNRGQEQQISLQFNSQNQNNFKPMNRPTRPSQSSTNQKRSKQQRKQQQTTQQRSHGQHNHQHVQSKINWGRCKMLQPSTEEKMKKAQVISKCLEVTPVPENITRETIELHRELVAACALREEGWFTNALSSDENGSSKISVNNTSNQNTMYLNTNLTTSSIDAMSSGNLKNNSYDQIKEDASKFNNSLTASESVLKSIHLNGTKDDQKTADVPENSTIQFKNDRFDDQTTASHENKHSALESDDYAEEDLSGYSAIFTGQLTYNYAKAEREIRAKRFEPDVEEKVIQFHNTCKEEAQDKYSNPIQIIGQIQLYQACMDFYISAVCGIEVTY